MDKLEVEEDHGLDTRCVSATSEAPRSTDIARFGRRSLPRLPLAASLGGDWMRRRILHMEPVILDCQTVHHVCGAFRTLAIRLPRSRKEDTCPRGGSPAKANTGVFVEPSGRRMKRMTVGIRRREPLLRGHS